MKNYFSIFLIMLSIVLQGCVSNGIERHINSQDLAGIVNYMEQNEVDLALLELNRVLPVCEAYFKVKQYRLFEDCLSHYDSRENAKWTWFDGSFGTTFNQSGKDAVFHVWRAQLALDLSDYSTAKKHALAANQLFSSGDVSPVELVSVFNVMSGFTLDSHNKSWLFSRYQTAALGVLIISEANLDNFEAAKVNIDKLKSIDTLGYPERYEDQQHVWLAKGYMAIGEYQKALTTIEQSLSLSFSDIGSASVELLGAPINYSVALARGTQFGSYESRWAYQSEAQMNALNCHALLKLDKIAAAEVCYNDPDVKSVIQSFGDLSFLRLKDLGEIQYQQNKLEGAYQYFQKAIDLLEGQRSTTITDTAKIGVISNHINIYNTMVSTLIKLDQIEEAFEYTERAKSRALVDMLASKSVFGVQKNSNMTPLVAQLDKSNQQMLVSDSIENTRSNRGLKRKIETESPQLSSLITVTAKSYNELTAQLTNEEILVEYFGSDDSWYAFVIEKGEISVSELVVPKLEEHIANFRKQILKPQSSSYQESAQVLYNLLIKPLENKLNNQNITIVAHGPLHYLPFNALHDGNKFLIDKYSIRSLPSVSVQAYLDVNSEKHRDLNLLAIGNPDLGNVAFDLPAAQKEVETLAKVTPRSKLLVRDQATETALKANGLKARILHIASHGEFDPQQPLSSRLLLASDAQNDGFLTVSDIYNLNLNADLVTLSACETGLGDIKKGDDVIGLTRGFLFAGATSIVSSLWVVDDQATETLMVEFYSNINKKGKRDALRYAQLDIKNNYREHPFYWAAFQLIGKQ